MGKNNPHNSWEKIRLVAEMWWCGDDVCNCYQPKIDRISPNREAGRPWIRRKEVWRGTFYSEPSNDEFAEMEKELKEAKKKYGIK